jgi:hypothetical protein
MGYLYAGVAAVVVAVAAFVWSVWDYGNLMRQQQRVQGRQLTGGGAW